MGPDGGAPHERQQSRFALSPAAAFALVGAVVAAVVLQRAFVAAHRTLGWAVACGVVALLLDPVVHWLDERLPRVLAILASLIGLAGLVGIAMFGVVRQIGDSLERLSQTAPEAARRLANSSWRAASHRSWKPSSAVCGKRRSPASARPRPT